MSDIPMLTCSSCGARFTWTQEEQIEAVRAMPLDDVGFGDKSSFVKPPSECKSCREKQNPRRS